MTEQARPSAAADYDSPWKEVVIHFFESFMSFFFHDIHAAIDWRRPVEFLDKELQQLAVEAEVGRRLADTLVKVWLRTGVEVWVLVHIEVQGQRDPDFERRMFVYYYRIFDRYNRQVISLAVLADIVRSWRPAEYRSELFQSGVRLRFRTVKLLDYSSRLAELQTDNNPFAVVVLAHLQAQATRRKMDERYSAKFQLMRLLYERGHPAEEIRRLFRFIDWLMTLPQELAQTFRREMYAYEEERNMTYVTSIERLAIEEGRQIGLAEGLQQGLQQLVLRQLKHLFGDLETEVQTHVRGLPLADLEQLAEALLDFTSPADLQLWLAEHPPRSDQGSGQDSDQDSNQDIDN
jgi:hypothetical protein